MGAVPEPRWRSLRGHAEGGPGILWRSTLRGSGDRRPLSRDGGGGDDPRCNELPGSAQWDERCCSIPSPEGKALWRTWLDGYRLGDRCRLRGAIDRRGSDVGAP